jgi:redox-sensitive bicupin YhaK (pirin superfamily)
MTLATPSVFAHGELATGATLTLSVAERHELALYVLAGKLESETGSPVAAGELAVLTPGSRVVLTAAGDRPATVALIGGQPAEGPILFAGPFVMDTPERLVRAREDYLAGRMGRLEGVPF